MVPRWRSLANTVRSRELAAPRGLKTASEPSSELLKRLSAWRYEPNILTAGELLETAIVEGQEPEAIKAAKHLLSPSTKATALLKKQAMLLLLKTGDAAEIPAADRLPAQDALSNWRQRTRLHPEDALAWVELARCYVILGDHIRAERAMRVALGLAPNNRHVLRSASRLFLHLEEFDRAHDLFLRSPATKSDPWLISAEISLSQVAERRPSFYKSGLAMLAEEKYLPRQLTELAGAAATTEMLDGSRKRAVRLFRQSVIDPNGNALAQAEWATPVVGKVIVSESNLRLAEEAYEAKTFHFHRIGQFEDVAPACVQWSSEEPFSIRPYEFGAATANIIDEYELGLQLATRGLRIRPGSPRLLNSTAFALANLGKLDEAEMFLDQMKAGAADEAVLVAQANRGLIAFRRNQLELGASLYKKAIDGFRYKQNIFLTASARLYFARELIRAKLPDGPDLLRQAKAEIKKHSWLDLEHVADATEEMLTRHENEDMPVVEHP